MQSVFSVPKLLSIAVGLSKSQMLMTLCFFWNLISILFYLPLDSFFDFCSPLSTFASFSDSFYLLIDGFFSFAFHEWKEDFVVTSLF